MRFSLTSAGTKTRSGQYHKQPSETPLSDQTRYIEQVRRLFLSRACVQGTFGSTYEKLVAELYQRHVPLEQVERAYLLGCARKYVALLNRPSAAPISSLHYFTAVLSEVEELKVSADYWSYLSHKVDRLRAAPAAGICCRAAWSRKLCATKSALSNPKQRRNVMMMTYPYREEMALILDRSRSLRPT